MFELRQRSTLRRSDKSPHSNGLISYQLRDGVDEDFSFLLDRSASQPDVVQQPIPVVRARSLIPSADAEADFVVVAIAGKAMFDHNCFQFRFIVRHITGIKGDGLRVEINSRPD